MKITTNKIDGTYNGKECYVHGRAVALDENNLIMTMQKLNTEGIDAFSPLYVLKSGNGGESWSEPLRDSAFEAQDMGECFIVGSDGGHIFHKKTGKAVIIGHTVTYKKGEIKPYHGAKRNTFYSVYNSKTESYNKAKFLSVPEDIFPNGCGAGSVQCVEDTNGDLLIPVYFDMGGFYKSAVLRCAFDGEDITFKEMSNILSYDFERGLCEPSLCFFGGKYYLTMRNDDIGLLSVSDDCKTFSEPRVWKWDTGDILPTYNTQSHWLLCGGKLYLVYTRKAGNNDHIFRHRAPLFMAEFDRENMCILRHSEVVVAPERGARLGNFGVTQINENKALITACEWMQPAGCEKYGSDNSVFITKVECNEN